MVPTLSPSSLTFGATDLGTVSPAQTVTVSAPFGDPVTTAPSDYPGDSGGFLLSTGTCATQTPCQISVTYQPYAFGIQSETYFVIDAITQEKTSLHLQGMGGVVTDTLSPSSLAFAARDEGSTSISQVITLTNTGDAGMTISSVTFAGTNPGDFSIQGNTCGSGLSSGQNCAISVSFNPTASGARSASLQIVSNSASSPDSVQLSGTGN